jgi:hypothetical protein
MRTPAARLLRIGRVSLGLVPVSFFLVLLIAYRDDEYWAGFVFAALFPLWILCVVLILIAGKWPLPVSFVSLAGALLGLPLSLSIGAGIYNKLIGVAIFAGLPLVAGIAFWSAGTQPFSEDTASHSPS